MKKKNMKYLERKLSEQLYQENLEKHADIVKWIKNELKTRVEMLSNVLPIHYSETKNKYSITYTTDEKETTLAFKIGQENNTPYLYSYSKVVNKKETSNEDDAILDDSRFMLKDAGMIQISVSKQLTKLVESCYSPELMLKS